MEETTTVAAVVGITEEAAVVAAAVGITEEAAVVVAAAGITEETAAVAAAAGITEEAAAVVAVTAIRIAVVAAVIFLHAPTVAIMMLTMPLSTDCAIPAVPVIAVTKSGSTSLTLKDTAKSSVFSLYTDLSIAQNSYMQKIVEWYKYFSDKRFSTIAGTLVYFLLMSIAPFLFWLTLLAGSIDIQKFLSDELFAAVKPVIDYLKESAESAAGGAGIVLIATSLYSSANFFYHLRRSGEIIFDCDRKKGGVRLRLSAIVLVIGTIIAFSIVGALSVSGIVILESFIPSTISRIITCFFVMFVSFWVALLLNFFACPYRLKFNQALPGSFLTTALWIVFAVGFSIYMQFSDPSMLYGKISVLIVFLLWCYLMVNSLVIGIIYNGSFLTERRNKKIF